MRHVAFQSGVLRLDSYFLRHGQPHSCRSPCESQVGVARLTERPHLDRFSDLTAEYRIPERAWSLLVRIVCGDRNLGTLLRLPQTPTASRLRRGVDDSW